MVPYIVWLRPALWKKLELMYIDAHCHLDFEAFDEDRAAVIERARAHGVERFVISGVEPMGWPRQQQLAHRYPGIVWSAGLHPVFVAKSERADIERWLRDIEGLFTSPNPPAAIGETGLDKRFALRASLDIQRFAFRKHIDLALDLNCPLILHVVGCHGSALDILTGCAPSAGMVHAFSGSTEVMQAYLKLGFYIGFGTSIMRMKPERAYGLINAIPADRILIESDAPDQPIIKGDRNEPAVVIEVAKHIARLRGCEESEILRISATNCETFLGDNAWS